MDQPADRSDLVEAPVHRMRQWISGGTARSSSPARKRLTRLLDEADDSIAWVERVAEYLRSEHGARSPAGVDPRLVDRLTRLWNSSPSMRMQTRSLLHCLAVCARHGSRDAVQALTSCRSLAPVMSVATIPPVFRVSRTALANCIAPSAASVTEPVPIRSLVRPGMTTGEIADLLCAAVDRERLSSIILIAHRVIAERDVRILPAIPIAFSKLWPDLPLSTVFSCVVDDLASPPSVAALDRLESLITDDHRLALAAFPEWVSLCVFLRRSSNIVAVSLSGPGPARVSCCRWLDDVFTGAGDDDDMVNVIRTGGPAGDVIGAALIPVSEACSRASWPPEFIHQATEHWIDLAPILPNAAQIARVGLDRLIASLPSGRASAYRSRAASLWQHLPHMAPATQQHKP